MPREDREYRNYRDDDDDRRRESHPFRGNQYTSGSSRDDDRSYRSRGRDDDDASGSEARGK